MAKHKKTAPAAKKKPAAKQTKTVKSTKPTVKPKAKPKAAPKVKPTAKPKAQPKPTPKAKPPAKPAAKTKAKSKPVVSVKAASKKHPPVPVKKTDASSKQPAKGKTNPPIPPKAPSTGKTTPPVPVPAKKIAAPVAPVAKSRPPIAAPAPTAKSTPIVALKTAAPKVALEAKTSVPRAVPPTDKAAAKASARDLLRTRILGAKKANKPIAFSLDEIREIAKTSAPSKDTSTDSDEKPAPKSSAAPKPTKIDLSKLDKPSQPHHIKAASLADILGFNPRKAQKAVIAIDPETIPEKFRRYYKLLLDLRMHLTAGIELHSEETLKRSTKDDSGDLSGYGQHMADSGTDTFDRDFALSLVSSEQEALTEIEAAIKRILDGSYGVCEATQKPIAKDRLLAVPFTRYSAEAQKDIERNRMRTRSSAGLFGEMGEEGGKIPSDGGGDDE